MKKVIVSLVTYNSEQYLLDFFDSLRQQTFADWELLVVDNNSFDASVRIVREHFPNAKIICQKANIGFSRAHNLIINWSDSAYVLVVNPDIILEPDCIERLVQCLDAHDDVASAGGKLLYWDFEHHRKTTQIDTAGLRMSSSYRVIDAYQGEDDRSVESGNVFGISGSLVMLRRSALEQVKVPRGTGSAFEYFDEDFFAYKEDADLAWRLIIAGWKNYLLKETLGFHHR